LKKGGWVRVARVLNCKDELSRAGEEVLKGKGHK